MDDSKSLDLNGDSKMTCEGEDEDWEDEDDWADGDEDDDANKANERLVHVRSNRDKFKISITTSIFLTSAATHALILNELITCDYSNGDLPSGWSAIIGRDEASSRYMIAYSAGDGVVLKNRSQLL